MPVYPLVPRVQHGGSAGPGAEARGIGADGAQGLGGGPEEDVEDRPAVLQRDPGDRPGQREDDMEVRDRQDAAGLPVHPLARCGALAGRAMAVAAGLPDGMHVAAAGAPVRDAAERRRPAALDAVHDLQRDGVERAVHALAESLSGAAEDVRHAGPVAAHRSDGCGEGGHRMVEPAEHGARGAGVDARRFRGLVPEKVLDHTGRRPAFMQVRSNRVTLMSCTTNLDPFDSPVDADPNIAQHQLDKFDRHAGPLCNVLWRFRSAAEFLASLVKSGSGQQQWQ